MSDDHTDKQLVPRKRRAWVYYCSFFLFVLFALGVLFIGFFVRNSGRWPAVCGYGEAVGYYFIQGRPLPDSIVELEETYNLYDRRRVPELPTPPWRLRPQYRPVGDLRGGPYLILVESVPPGRGDWMRYIAYANADGSSVVIKDIWEWELAEYIAADDKLRSRNKHLR